MPGKESLLTAALLTPLLLSSMNCWSARKSSPDVEAPRPAPIVVQPAPVPCLDPGPQPIPPSRLGLVHDPSLDRYSISKSDFKALWDWMVDSFLWADAAELCLNAQRNAGAQP